MLYLIVTLTVVVIGALGVVVLVEFRARKRRGEVRAVVDGRRKPKVDHYEPTAGTASTRKAKRKKQKRDSYAFHPVPPTEHEANRKRAGLGGEMRIKRRRDRDTSDSPAAWSSSAGYDNSTSYDSTSSQDASPASTYDSPSYDSTSYESTSDYGSSDSDSGWSSSSDSSSSDSSSGGDFGGGGSSDSY